MLHAVKYSRVAQLTRNPIANGAKKESSSRKPVSSTAKRVIDLEGKVVFKPVLRKGTGFPRFEEGTVCIEVAKRDEDCRYAFEKHVLDRASSWFADQMNRQVDELDDKIAEKGRKNTGYDIRFELVYSQKYDLWVLRRTVSFRRPEWESIRP
jgi:hypothetical protein